MSSRTKKILIAIACVVALAVYAYVKVFRIHGFIVALEPIDRERAIVCVRANEEYGQPPRAWVALLDGRGGYAWWKKLDGLPITARRDGLLVDRGLVIVRTDLDGKTSLTTAYALESGEKKWATPSEGVHGTPSIDLVAAGDRILEGVSTGGARNSLVALERSTGRVAWTFGLPSNTHDLRTRDGLLFLDGISPQTPGVAPVEGAPTGSNLFSTDGALCFDEDEHFYFDRTPDGARFVARRGTGEPRVVVADLPFAAGAPPILRCGRYGEHFVLALGLDYGKDVALLEIDPAAGRHVAFTQLRLGSADVARVRQTMMDWAFPEHAPLNGTMPRFVPLLVRAEPKGDQLAVVDIQERRIVRRGPGNGGEYRMIHVIAEGDAFYLQEQQIGTGTLARFDGRTGALTAAIEMETPADVRPFHVKDGRIWVYRGVWLDALPYAVLDAETLKPIVTHGGMTVKDVLAERKKAWLGE